MVQRHIGLARVRPELAPSTTGPPPIVHLELTLHHATTRVAARTTRLPFYDPPRRTA